MTDARPKLLFLCQNLPFPPDGGALIRSYHTLRLLAETYDVHALCFVRAASRPTPDAVRRGVEGLGEHAEVEAFPIPQERSRLRYAWDHLRSLGGGRAYTRWAYESVPFRRRVDELLAAHRFEVIHLDSLDLVAYLPGLPDGSTVSLAHHNVESQLLARRAETYSGIRRAVMHRQAELTRLEEATWCPRVDVNIVVSDDDRETLASIAPGGRYVVVPNGVDTVSFRPAEAPVNDHELVFVGGHTWFPNRDGMEYFVESILPRIREAVPDVVVTWVGRASEQVRKEYAVHGVDVTGYVEDIRPYVDRAACSIVPLRVGGGTRLKILDAWALGKAVISTPQGCEGLETHHERNILVADDAEAFARATVRVLKDPELRDRLATGGRRTVERRYDWDAVGRTLLGLLTSMRERPGA